MIEPTDEMLYAALDAYDDLCDGQRSEDGFRAALGAVLAIVERDYVIGPPRVTPIDPGAPVHLVAGGATTACCSRTLFELPHNHRCTLNPELRTCRGPSFIPTGD